jgi:hypothetical protein
VLKPETSAPAVSYANQVTRLIRMMWPLLVVGPLLSLVVVVDKDHSVSRFDIHFVLPEVHLHSAVTWSHSNGSRRAWWNKDLHEDNAFFALMTAGVWIADSDDNWYSVGGNVAFVFYSYTGRQGNVAVNDLSHLMRKRRSYWIVRNRRINLCWRQLVDWWQDLNWFLRWNVKGLAISSSAV